MMDDVESVDKMTGDPAYLSRDNCEIVADKGGVFQTKEERHAKAKESSLEGDDNGVA